MALELLPTYQDSKEEAGSAYESSYERAKTELDAAKTELEALRKAALDIRLAATLTDPSLLPSTMTTAPTFDADKVAEEMERLLGMEQAQFSPGATPWLIGGLGAGYAPPTSSEMLPNMLLSSEAQAFVKEHKDLYTTFNVSEFPQYGLWLSISRWGTDWALINITGHAAGEAPQALPFFALWDEGDDATQKNAPRPTMVPWLAQPRSDVWVPWLGCRCSWPVTQQCWFFYFSNVQAIATLWMTVLCIFLWGLLEGLIVKDFIAKVPDKITFWVDYATHPTPLSTRICMFLIFTVFPFYVVAFVSNGNKLTENYYAGLYQLRVMLRSLASRPEAGTYAYCTLAYWTILTEIWTVKQRPASQGQMTQAT